MKNKTSHKTDPDAGGASAKTTESTGKLVPLNLSPLSEIKNGYELVHVMRDALQGMLYMYLQNRVTLASIALFALLQFIASILTRQASYTEISTHAI